MRKTQLILFLLASQALPVYAADLIEVTQQALHSDPTYQQAISQALADKENLPISIASLLPNISLNAQPSITRTASSGANTSTGAFFPRNNTARAYVLTLTATQTVFNAAQFASVAGSLSTVKQAEATLNAAMQDLMIRVSTAYFNVLKDEENLNYNLASKVAYAEQLSQVKTQYEVGVKTITDVYNAQASYDTATASYIAAQATLSNDRENLRVITGKYYPKLSRLSDNFPLISPRPHEMEAWVKTAQLQNWTIKANQYAADVAGQNVKQQFAGHLPTVSVQGNLNRDYTNNINGYFNISGQRNGPSTQTNREIMLNMTVPIFAGGGVTAQTNQAAYQYRVTLQQLEQAVRSTLNTTRQSYSNINAGISQVSADKQAIKSAISALEGMQVSYQVGTETLVDVLNQRQKVFQAQTQYATDRYAFVNNILALKQAAGTLSFDDLRALNAWLNDTDDSKSAVVAKLKPMHMKKKSVTLKSASSEPRKHNKPVKLLAKRK